MLNEGISFLLSRTPFVRGTRLIKQRQNTIPERFSRTCESVSMVVLFLHILSSNGAALRPQELLVPASNVTTGDVPSCQCSKYHQILVIVTKELSTFTSTCAG